MQILGNLAGLDNNLCNIVTELVFTPGHCVWTTPNCFSVNVIYCLQ